MTIFVIGGTGFIGTRVIPLLVARGEAALVRHGADVHALDHQNSTPLHWAAARDSAACCRLLLSAGAAVNAAAEEGWTPLHAAAVHRASASAAELLAAGADPSRVAGRGLTPAAAAASKGHALLATLLADAARWSGMRRAALTAWCWRWER